MREAYSIMFLTTKLLSLTIIILTDHNNLIQADFYLYDQDFCYWRKMGRKSSLAAKNWVIPLARQGFSCFHVITLF